MSRLNWQRASRRSRAAQNGTENISDYGFLSGSIPHRSRTSKSSLRIELAVATQKITRTIKCQCGHTGQVTMLASRRNKRLRCSKCGQVALNG